MNKNFNKFYIFGPVAPNSQSITMSDCHAALCQPDDCNDLISVSSVRRIFSFCYTAQYKITLCPFSSTVTRRLSML